MKTITVMIIVYTHKQEMRITVAPHLLMDTQPVPEQWLPHGFSVFSLHDVPWHRASPWLVGSAVLALSPCSSLCPLAWLGSTV